VAVFKLTRSKKALLFIDDDGNTFVTSVAVVRNIIDDKIRVPFASMKRLPFKTSPDRFEKSELYLPPGYVAPREDKGEDGLDPRYLKRKEVKKSYEDKMVW